VDRRQEEDRRTTERYSSPPIREHCRQINICLRFLLLLAFAASIFCLVRGFSVGGVEEISLGVFLASIFGVVAAFIYRYSVALSAYLHHESVANLDRAMERQAVFWMVASFMSVIFTLVYFVFNS
jgi:hypothetical protein